MLGQGHVSFCCGCYCCCSILRKKGGYGSIFVCVCICLCIYTNNNARHSFHCLFCDGFEERGVESAGIIATGFSGVPEVAKHGLGMAARLAKHVNVYTNGNSALESELRTGYKSKKFAYDGRVIAKLRLVGDGPQVEITFDDGTTKTEGWITNHPFVEQKAPFAEQLGLKLAKSGEIEVTPPFLETSLPGCFAAGDAASMLRSAGQALYMGGMAGVGMSGQLQRELDAIGEL